MFIETTARLVAGPFRALFSNFGNLVKICGAWCLLLVLLQVPAIALLPGVRDGSYTADDALSLWNVVGAVSAAVFVLAVFSFAVAWHRCLLLGEAPSIPYLRFWVRELKFAVRGVLVGLLCLPLMAVGLTIVVIWQPSSIAEFMLLAVVLNLVIAPFLLRMSMMLPAVAIDHPLTIGEAFTDSDGLGLPMAIAAMVISVGTSLVDYGIGQVVALVSSSPTTLVYLTLSVDLAISFVSIALALGVVTCGYEMMRDRQMAEKERQPEATPEPTQ